MAAFKADEIKRLTESAWSKKVSAELIRSSIPRFKELLENISHVLVYKVFGKMYQN